MSNYAMKNSYFNLQFHENNSICIDSGKIVSLNNNGKGTHLFCTKGLLWITQENDPNDYLITNDQFFEITSKGKVIIQGMDNSCFELQKAS